jgi:cell division protein ZapA (FtsZ GTPase activity inhibitor)
VSSELEVKIFGQAFRLRGDDPARIERAAAFVDGKMKQLLSSPTQGLSARGAVLTALEITDEWFTSQDEEEKIVSDLSERVEELISLLPE